MTSWNDLKYLLQVWRDGTTLAASRTLGTSQSTVMRRIAVIEQELGLQLFEKQRTGYVPTQALKALLPEMEAAAEAHEAFARKAATLARSISGIIRLTVPELLITNFVAPALLELRNRQPAIRIELVTTDRFLDLSAGEADLAIRGGDPPTQPALFGRRLLGKEGWSVFCSRGYAAAHGMPACVEDLAGHSVVAVMEGLYPSAIIDWVEGYVATSRSAQRHSSLASVYAAVKAGLGVSIAPDLVILADPDMVRCFPVGIDPGKELWLLAPAHHRETQHVRVAMEFLGGFLAEKVRTGLAGSSDGST